MPPRKNSPAAGAPARAQQLLDALDDQAMIEYQRLLRAATRVEPRAGGVLALYTKSAARGAAPTLVQPPVYRDTRAEIARLRAAHRRLAADFVASGQPELATEMRRVCDEADALEQYDRLANARAERAAAVDAAEAEALRAIVADASHPADERLAARKRVEELAAAARAAAMQPRIAHFVAAQPQVLSAAAVPAPAPAPVKKKAAAAAAAAAVVGENAEAEPAAPAPKPKARRTKAVIAAEAAAAAAAEEPAAPKPKARRTKAAAAAEQAIAEVPAAVAAAPAQIVERNRRVKEAVLPQILGRFPLERLPVQMRTIDECTSKARTKPFYMTKEQLLATIDSDPELQRFFGKGYRSMTKEQLCQVMFRVGAAAAAASPRGRE